MNGRAGYYLPARIFEEEAMLRRIALIVLLLIVAGVASADTLKVRNLAGKDRAQIDRLLGKPDQCETVSPNRVGPVPHCTYRGGTVEIVFIRGAADWITFRQVPGAFVPDSLRGFGVEPSPPSFRNQFVMRWSDLSGFREVAMFPDRNGGIETVLVKVATD